MDEIHIASMVVQARQEDIPTLQKLAEKLPNPECQVGDNKLVIVFEANSDQELSDTIETINSWPGLLSAQLAYHHCESSQSLEEEIPHESYAS